MNNLVRTAFLCTNFVFLQCQFSINIYLFGGLKYVPICQKLLSPASPQQK